MYKRLKQHLSDWREFLKTKPISYTQYCVLTMHTKISFIQRKNEFIETK